MRVAFVYAPVKHETFEENLKVVDEDFGRLPPIGLAYAAALAEKAGHTAAVFDANAAGLSLTQTLAAVEAFRPDALAGTLSTYMFRATTSWLAALKERLRVPVIVGGTNLRLYPRETLAHPAIDHGILHFGTKGLPLLLDALEHGRDPAGLPETASRRGREVVLGEVDAAADPFRELPFPARHLLDNRLYSSFISQRRNFTVMVTSTGCPCACTFCAIAPAPRHLNSLDRVLAEVRDCVDRHGVREIDFFDSDLFISRERGLELCRRLAGLGLDLEWSCRTRSQSLDRELLGLAKAAGCRQVYIGLETPDPEAQARMHKGLSTQAAAETLLRVHEAGIRPLGFFMLGVPGETHRSAWRTIRWALSLPLDYAQFSRMIAKPGSGLHQELVEKTGTDYWRDLVLGRPLPPRLPNIWSGLGEAAVEAYAKLAYLLFYFRPALLLRSFLRLRSGGEALRSARTAARMILHLLHSDL